MLSAAQILTPWDDALAVIMHTHTNTIENAFLGSVGYLARYLIVL